MSRPKKTLPPSKDKQLTIRFTDKLFEALSKDAKASGLPRTEYIRQLITNGHPVIKQQTVFEDERILQIFRNLGHYGGNLNQIAAHLNSGGNMTNPMWKEIKECIAEIYEIRDALQEMAGEYHGSH